MNVGDDGKRCPFDLVKALLELAGDFRIRLSSSRSRKYRMRSDWCPHSETLPFFSYSTSVRG